jgi:hypothetical protein
MNEAVMKIAEAFCAWPTTYQAAGAAFLILAALWFVHGCWATLLSSVTILFRGHPPATPESAMECNYPEPEDHGCEHEDNLTHKCLRQGGPCRTISECNLTVESVCPDKPAI